jgi:hypothetical protein
MRNTPERRDPTLSDALNTIVGALGQAGWHLDCHLSEPNTSTYAATRGDDIVMFAARSLTDHEAFCGHPRYFTTRRCGRMACWNYASRHANQHRATDEKEEV